jgi:hypothetical protein
LLHIVPSLTYYHYHTYCYLLLTTIFYYYYDIILSAEEEDPEELEQEVARLESELPQYALTPKEEAEKAKLIAEAFQDWTRKDLKAFIASLERNGRDDKSSVLREVMQETGKAEADISRYYDVFWKRSVVYSY